MKFFCFVTVVASLALSVSALNCWVCENERSNQNCMDNGKMRKCQANQRACQNEVRTDNHGLRITKRCKQAHACDNNFIQNPRPAWFPSQCNLNVLHTVCRCCCNTDGCNAPALACLGATCDPPHNNPANGRVVCTDSNNDDSVCTFTCNAGYELVGLPESTCNVVEETGTWSSRAPTCRPTVCIPPQQAPFNGRYSCDNGNTLGSTCSFTCDVGFYLEGQAATVCVVGAEGNVWSNRRPICIPIICTPPQTAILNGGVSCTDANRLSSLCSFTCNNGFHLVGLPDRECVDDFDNDALGVWTNERPVCEPNVCVPAHVDPSNGDVSCTNGNVDGSTCTFTCNSGYALVGSPTSSCLSIDGVTDWDAPAPVCEPVTCPPPMAGPVNGQVVCTNSNFDGSECTFACDANYALIGAGTVTCNDDLNDDVFGLWSDPAPICQPIICLPEQINPFNGAVSCSNSNFATSDCTFTCDNLFALIGAPVTTCVDDGNGDALGVWTTQAPVCEPITCEPAHSAPTNGQVSCTNFNFETSACTFTCDAGFSLVGAPESTCANNADGDQFGDWSSPAPVCQRIICLPPQSAPLNGGVVCTDENREGSVCTFGCDRGYARVGSETTTCLDDGDSDTLGEWSLPAPTCEPIVCEPPYDVGPLNGGVFCTNNNFMDSVCVFSCGSAFSLVGSPEATCVDNNDGDTLGVWTALPPICEPIKCEPPHSDPSNGLVDCTNTNFLDSVCSFACDAGFALTGVSTSVCVDDGNSDALGEWSSPAPTCQPIVCEPPRSNPANGVVECTNSNLLGSICTTICDEAFTVGGNPVTTCVEDGDGNALGVWSEPPAVCNRKTCGTPPGPPANGFRACTDGNFRGSQCEFGCNDYHTRVGPLYTNCTEIDGTLVWDRPSPVCEPNVCPDQGVLLHGNYSCTDDLFATSTCTFECSGLGYKIYPPGRDQNTCMNDTAWDVAAPCCARDCPPFALMDAVFILDSSSSIGKDNWPIMKNFTKDILSSFAMTEDSARLAVFRYNRVVDGESQILLNDFKDIRPFLRKFDTIPYDGSGTRTGNALNYTRNVIFKPENGDRPGVKNVAVIITDGRSQDPVAALAEQLREDGVLTYALGIQPPRGALDVNQLNAIAGSPDRLLITQGSFEDLGEDLSAALAGQICGDPCADNHDHNENLRAAAAAAASRNGR